MNSAIFSACAGKTAFHLELEGVSIVNSAMGTSSNQSYTDKVLNPLISSDVRKLISMHDRGIIQAFEVKDTSYKAVLSFIKHLGSVAGISRHNGLTPELLAQAIKFIKSVPAEQVFLRFEVTDKKPTIPNFNPAHICAYDAERSYGTDYLQIARRLTIYGSTSSVMNHTDLGTFLESGKRKCVILYLGTQKNEDVDFLNPAHTMALDLVVTGLEQSEDVEELLAKADTILLHPEIAKLQQEAAAIQVMLTEFRNHFDPEDGKEIAKRLLKLQASLDELMNRDVPAEFINPIGELTISMLTDDLIKEIIEYNDLLTEGAAPSSVELETLQAAIDYIIADSNLSVEKQGQQILNLLQVGVPSLLEGGDITANQLTVFLENLQVRLTEKKISLPAPLMAQPAMWELEHSGKLADLILVLLSPEQKDTFKEALKNTPEGMEILEALSRISETLDLGNIEKAVLIEKIHKALTTTTLENAALASALLHVMAFTHEPDLISLTSAPMQLSLYSFTIDTLFAQHHIAIEGVAKHIRQLTDNAIKVEFNPPYALPSTNDNGITILSFLVQPAALTEMAALPPKQLSELIKGLSDPVIKEHAKNHHEALRVLESIETLRAENGVLATNKALFQNQFEALNKSSFQHILETNLQTTDIPNPPNSERFFIPTYTPNLFQTFSLQSLSRIVSSQKIIEHHLELLAMAASKGSEPITVRSGDRVVNTPPPHRQPPELSTLASVTPYLNPTTPPAPQVITPFTPRDTEINATQTGGKPDSLSSRPISPQREPKPWITPVNDNLLPETQKTTSLRQEFGKVCGKTGQLVCNCENEGSGLDGSKNDKFKTTIQNLKLGEETKLGNGTTIEVLEARTKKDGTTETIFAWKDRNTTVFEGTMDDIQQQIKKNAEEVKKNADRYERKFENEPAPTDTIIASLKEQINITLIEPGGNTDAPTPSKTPFDDPDFDPDFGDDDHHTTPTHQSSAFSPK